MRNRIDVGQRAIAAVEASEFKGILDPEIQMVKTMVSDLKTSRGTQKGEVMDCNIQNLAEICNMLNPKQEVVNIMKCLCLVMGIPREDVVSHFKGTFVKCFPPT